MKILVTGGSGFIGTNIIALLESKGIDAINYDLKTCFDILDSKTLLEKTKGVDAIMHLAAKVRVHECEENPAETLRVNALGTENVLCAAAENSVGKVIIASSAAVYGNNPNIPLKETAHAAPLNIYGLSKLAAEKIALNYSERRGLHVTCFRIFNVYGPGQDASSPYSAAIPLFISRALRNQDLVIYGDGLQTRDFIYVKDVANIFFSALNGALGGKIINVASGKTISIFDLAKQIITATNSESKIKHEPARNSDIKQSVADMALASQSSMAPAFALEQGLNETIAWFRKCAPS